LLAGGLVVLATCSAAVPARIDGLTLQVTSTADAVDDNPGDGVCHAAGLPATADCTLRAAVQTANATPGADTILLRGGTLVKSPAVYRLTISTPYEEAAAKGDLDVTNPLTIGVPGGRTRGIAAGAPAIEGIGQDRIFDVKSAGSLTLTGVIVRGGVAGGGNEGFGGGIRAEGNLVLASDTITGNSADYGGGVSSATSLVASNTTFSKNRALLAGGIFDRGTISLSRVVVTNNTSVDPNVPLGGIENQGTATI
jgi:CSLREA domain-containing protein